MNSPLAASRPIDYPELVSWSTASLSDLPLPATPALDARPADGWGERVDGRGVFVRRTEIGAAPAPDPDPAAVGGPESGVAARGLPDAWYIHGLAGSSTNWTQLAGLLAGHAVGYAVDLPGHGRSDPPPRGSYSLGDFADLTATLIRRRSPKPVHLVGNSLGGMVAVALAARHPQLVRTLTLISPAVPDTRLRGDRGADPRLALLLLPGTSAPAIRRLSSLSPAGRARGMALACFGDPGLITPDQFAAAAADLAWRTGLPWVHTVLLGSLRALMTSYLTRGAGTFQAAAARIAVPTLVIWGTSDRLVDPRLARPTAAAFRDARVLMLRGVGHTAMMEDPLTTAHAVHALWHNDSRPASAVDRSER